MKVLIAVEDKVYGNAIADFVTKLKWQSGALFKVLHVRPADSPFMLGDNTCCEASRNLWEERNRADRSLVSGIATKIQVSLGGITVEEQITTGHPKESILEVAQEWEAEMIVLGSHGRTGFGRFLLGSVSAIVLAHATCSVMIVKLPAAADEPTQKESALGNSKSADLSSANLIR